MSPTTADRRRCRTARRGTTGARRDRPLRAGRRRGSAPRASWSAESAMLATRPRPERWSGGGTRGMTDDETAGDEAGPPPASDPPPAEPAAPVESADSAEPAAAPPPGRSRRRSRRLVGVALAAVLVAAVVVAAVVREPPAEPEGTVILYGDSLSVEARDAFADRLHATTRADVVLRAVPGLSPCDVRPRMEEDAALRPDVVVIQFVGNNE